MTGIQRSLMFKMLILNRLGSEQFLREDRTLFYTTFCISCKLDKEIRKRKDRDLFSFLSREKGLVSNYTSKMIMLTSGELYNRFRMKNSSNHSNFATLSTNQWKRMVLAREPSQNPRLEFDWLSASFRFAVIGSAFCFYNSPQSSKFTFAIPKQPRFSLPKWREVLKEHHLYLMFSRHCEKYRKYFDNLRNWNKIKFEKFPR